MADYDDYTDRIQGGEDTRSGLDWFFDDLMRPIGLGTDWMCGSCGADIYEGEGSCSNCGAATGM